MAGRAESSKWWYEQGLKDASDEIKWLRAENLGLKGANERCGKYLAQVTAHRDAEVERLRAALDRIRTLDHGKDWKVEAPDIIAHLVAIATEALA